jgi:hypothetical protein
MKGIPENFILPEYGGYSITNVVPTILKIFGVDVKLSTLREEIIPTSLDSISKVVLFILDALGFQHLDEFRRRKGIPVLEKLIETGGYTHITSTFPTTTTTALSSLYTGMPPARHGIFGYQMFLKEFGVVANMVTLTPIFDGERDRLLLFGFEPEKFLWCEPILKFFDSNSIEHFHLIKRTYAGSGLSRIFFDDNLDTFIHLSDMMVKIKRYLENTKGKVFITAYWDDIDSLSHLYGPDSEEVYEELRLFFHSLETILFKELREEVKGETLFILISDHGQIRISQEKYYKLSRYPYFKKSLLFQPTGEFRSAYLYVKQNRVENLKKYIESNFPQLWVVESREALDMGLFGEPDDRHDPQERIGDLVVIPKDNGVFAYLPEKTSLKGRHGGLSREEIIVPFLWGRIKDLL